MQCDNKDKDDGGAGFKRNIGGGIGSYKKIDSFFKKKPRLEHDIDKHPKNTLMLTTNTSDICAATDASTSTAIVTLEPEKQHSPVIDDIQCMPISYKSVSDSDQLKNSLSLSTFSSDIGWYVGKNIDDCTKAILLEKHWIPPPNYVFPHCVVNKKGKLTKKYAQKSHLDKFHWLVLSHKEQGLYCKYCVLFGGAAQSQTPRRFVKEPLKAFDDLLGEKGALLKHQRNPYHGLAVEAGKSFLSIFHKPETSIINQVSSQRMTQINENRERLRPIVKTIIFCGKQNIALRGHRDSGKLLNEISGNESVVADEGNFRALLKFRIDSGDTTLQNHLETSNSNATYISKTVQNELIDVCKEIIQESIVKNVKKAKYFSILFDETTDVSHTSQLSLLFRYLHNGIIREDFITFCDTYDMLRSDKLNNTSDIEHRLTGVALAKIVENLCLKFDIDLEWCVGIGTDNCSVMASETKGAVQELMKKAIHAKRCPCSNHILNNSLATSSKVVSCRNTSGTMRKVVAFANASAKRHQIFEQELGVKMQGICETRWVERHDGHLQFQGDSLMKICSALEKIATWQDNKTASDAHCLLLTLRSSDFIVSSICLNDVLGRYLSCLLSFFDTFLLQGGKCVCGL